MIVFASIFFLALTGCDSKRKTDVSVQQKAGPRPPVRADGYVVRTQTMLNNIEIPGTIVANESTEIHPEVAGRVTGIYFREGAFVSRGTLLAKLNDADLRAQLNKLSVQLKIARQNEARSAQLLKIEGISRQDYEMSLLQVNTIQADMAIVQTQLAKTSVRAPYSGKLGLRLVSPGAYVSPQTPITTITQTSQMKIDFTVPEKYAGKLKMGQYLNFRVEGNERNYTARIAATENAVAESTRSLLVRASVVGEQAGLVPGNFAKVILNFEPDHNAIMVPTQAVIPQARGKKVYVASNGKAKFVEVETGVRDSSYVQILSGLKPGDTVLITGLLSLKPEGNVIVGRVVNAGKSETRTDTTAKKSGK